MDFVAKARLQLEKRQPFALYRKPDEKNVRALFQRDATTHVGDLERPGFVFAPFAEGLQLLLPDDACESFSAPFDLPSWVAGTPELTIDATAKSQFEALVIRGISAINAGHFEKVVLSRTEQVRVPGFDIFEAFAQLCGSYPSAFVYLWYHPETDVWMAATPERLLQADGLCFSTMSLAGTQKYQGEESVAWARKEREEQQFVTDFILDSLEGLAGEISQSQPYTVRAGNLLHIRTDIKGELKTASDLPRVISILHPTPAVCGLPKAPARNFIIANEGYAREYYSGFLGEINLGSKTDLYVNLRCMKVTGETAHLFMGCGITKDSNPEKEFFETVNKSLTIRKCLP